MKKIVGTFLSSIFALSIMLPSFSQEYTPSDVIKKVITTEQATYKGKKFQRVNRGNLRLEAYAGIEHIDSKSYKILMEEPSNISNIIILTKHGKTTIFFPTENLAFSDAIQSSASMIEETVLNKITSNFPLLQKNYSINFKNDDQILSQDTYVIDIQPISGNFRTPGKTFWISKKTFQILREDRYWHPTLEPFFTSQYVDFNFQSVIQNDLKVKLNGETKKINLDSPPKNNKEKPETFIYTYKTFQELEKQTQIKTSIPKFLPVGFELEQIQVLNFFDTQIFIQKYTDGLSSLFVTYRTKPNFFLTLMAGSFSLSLIHKMSDLGYHSPYNYIARETEEHLIVALGELYPDELKKVCESISLK